MLAPQVVEAVCIQEEDYIYHPTAYGQSNTRPEKDI